VRESFTSWLGAVAGPNGKMPETETFPKKNPGAHHMTYDVSPGLVFSPVTRKENKERKRNKRNRTNNNQSKNTKNSITGVGPSPQSPLLSIAQQFRVTQCFGGMSHCNLFCTLTLYLMLSHVLDFGGTL